MPFTSPWLGQCSFLDIDEDDLDTSCLHARAVKPATKQTLLCDEQQSWASAHSRSGIDAVILLSDLTRLAPSVAKEFVPKDYYARTNFSFRLINDIGCQSEEEGYVALSYCCRNGQRGTTPRRVITPIGDLPFGWTKEVEQFPLPTSAALFQAVLKERRIGEGLWFDQVCINQEDEMERSATMGAIDTIYKNARMVVVPLDDVSVPLEEEQILRCYVEQYSYSEVPPHQQPNTGLSPPFMQQFPALKSFIERVLNSAWFERAWCAHEMKMGQDHVFLVSCFSHYEDEVQTIIRLTGDFFLHLLVLASEDSTFTPANYARVHSLLDFFQCQVENNKSKVMAIQRPDTPQMALTEPTSFVGTIAEIFSMKAGGNPRLPEYLRRLDANRDKTWIALNSSRLPLALAPSSPFSRPSIEDECLRSLLLVGLAARDPVSLCTTGAPLRLHDGSVSWLSRPSSLDVDPAHPPPSFPKTANSITQASDGRAEFAQLDLIFLDLPHRTKPNPLFPSHITRARILIDLCIQYQIPATGLWNFWATPDHPRAPSLRNIFIQTLACVFDCGAQWLLDVSCSLHQPHTPTLDPYTIDMLLNPHLILQNYILLSDGQTALSCLLSVVSTLIASGMPWASGASERTHGPLIPSPPPPANAPAKALVFAPFAHSKTLLVAVPDAVKGQEYAGLARAWVLTSMNPFTGAPKGMVSWTVQGKGRVFGERGFEGVLAGCGRGEVRLHRVYG
ncbi:hypothetical protein IQ07DRAFT_532289, partial [Pyrenochaeta sp. DS3sAY3a]